MVLVPLLGIVARTGIIGWASAPYDPYWQQRYPRRAAWMSLAGPAANYLLATLAFFLLKIGLVLGVLTPGGHIVRSLSGNEIVDGIATVLAVMLTLNLLLGTFNLIPFPPLDGYSALGLFLPESYARKLEDFRISIRGFAFLGILLGWRFFGHYYTPLENGVLDLLLSGTRT